MDHHGPNILLNSVPNGVLNSAQNNAQNSVPNDNWSKAMILDNNKVKQHTTLVRWERVAVYVVSKLGLRSILDFWNACKIRKRCEISFQGCLYSYLDIDIITTKVKDTKSVSVLHLKFDTFENRS